MNGLTKSKAVFNFGNTLAMRIFFFMEMFKIWWRFHKWNKTLRKSLLFLRELHLNREPKIFSIRKRMHVIGSPCVNKHPYDFKLQSGRYFRNDFSWDWWKNMIKLLSWRFHKCSGTLNVLTVEECSDTVLFSEWSKQVLGGRRFRKYIGYGNLLFV